MSMTLDDIKRFIRDVDGSEDRADFLAAATLCAALQLGSDVDRISELLQVNADAIRDYVANGVASGVITADGTQCKWLEVTESDSERDAGLEFWLDVNVLQGTLVRYERDGQLSYQCTEHGLAEVERDILRDSSKRQLLEQLTANDVPGATLQDWFCEACGTWGIAPNKRGEDALKGFYRVEKAHRDRSKQCPAGTRHLRVRNPERCSLEEWEKLVLGSLNKTA